MEKLTQEDVDKILEAHKNGSGSPLKDEFKGKHLFCVNFKSLDLEGFSFHGSIIESCNFIRCYMEETDFSSVDFLADYWGMSDFYFCNLGLSNFRNSRLNARFVCCDLERANFSGSTPLSLVFRACLLEDAIISLDKDQLDKTIINCSDMKNSFPFCQEKTIHFSLPHHDVTYADGYIKIGCLRHSVKYWLKNYKSIGRDRNYSEAAIKLYGEMIRYIKYRFFSDETQPLR